MARKVSLSSQSVAYFDQQSGVDEPGFYVVEAETEKQSVRVQDGGAFKTEEAEIDGEKVTTLVTDERGRPVYEKVPTVQETIQVTVETVVKPGRRVYPSPDGEGFVYEPTKLVGGKVVFVDEEGNPKEGGDE